MNACVRSEDLKAAADPGSSPELLARLYKQREPELDRLLAGNPAMRTDWLCGLAYSWPVEFLDNPVVFLWALEGKEVSLNVSLVEAAALYRATMEEKGPEAAAKRVDRDTRCRLADLSELAIGLFPCLAKDPESFVREQIFRCLGRNSHSKRFPRAYLGLLDHCLDAAVKDPVPDVRKHLPGIMGMGEGRLLAMAEDPHPAVLHAIAALPSAWDAEPAQLRIIETGRRSVLQRLCANARVSQSVVMRLAEQDATIQLQLVRQKHLNADVALLMAGRASHKVCHALAQRDWSKSPAVYAAMAGRFKDVDLVLIQNPNLDGEAVRMVLNSVSIEERCRCATLPNISAAVLNDLAMDPEQKVRMALAQRMHAKGHKLGNPLHVSICNRLALCEEPEIRRLILPDRRLTSETIRHLLKSLDQPGTVLLAGNPMLPYEEAFRLLAHPDEGVARTALTNLGQKCAELLLRYGRNRKVVFSLYYALLSRQFLRVTQSLQPCRWQWIAAERGVPDTVLGWLADRGDPQLYEILATKRPFTHLGRFMEAADGQLYWVPWKMLTQRATAAMQRSSANPYQRGWHARFCPHPDEVQAIHAGDPHPFVRRMLMDNPRLSK